ncbi:hypothetical protein [Gulbenkiania mobilis]|uniref:hypothetical protein n=1 Tax=Gulbenkiania mobilis TaxID=397457 RepID=UPI00128EC2E4|nr:hypothetical protein [Gulbenkiania mobilis]
MTQTKAPSFDGAFFMGFLFGCSDGNGRGHGIRAQASLAPIDVGKYRSPWNGCDGHACTARLLSSVWHWVLGGQDLAGISAWVDLNKLQHVTVVMMHELAANGAAEIGPKTGDFTGGA